MKNKILLFGLIISVLTGCSQKEQVIKEVKLTQVPQYPLADEPKLIKPKKGSLFSSNAKSLFSDKKDLQVGDIIRVWIEESLSNSTSDSMTTSKTNTSGTSGGIITPSVTGSSSLVDSAINQTNGFIGLGYKGESSNNFKGSSTGSNTDIFKGNISAVIKKRYKNGNYFIVGTKNMYINGQKQIVQVSGIIRPYDIDPIDNRVYSQEIANLKVIYKKEGSFTNEIEKPWLSETLETISPF